MILDEISLSTQHGDQYRSAFPSSVGNSIVNAVENSRRSI